MISCQEKWHKHINLLQNELLIEKSLIKDPLNAQRATNSLNVLRNSYCFLKKVRLTDNDKCTFCQNIST